MTTVNIHAAKTNLSKLIERAEAGEYVVIARNGKPAVRLVPVAPVATGMEEPRHPNGLPAWMGSMRDEIWLAPDWDKPDEELINSFYESEIFPPDDDPPEGNPQR